MTDNLEAAVAAFLAEKTPELSPYSVTHLRASLTPMARSLSGPVGGVDYATLRAYVDGLALRYKPGTLRPVVGDIRQFWRWAKKRGYVQRNPAKRLRPPSRRVVMETATPKDADDADALALLRYLALRLERVVWRDLFGNLDAAPGSEWRYDERVTVRDLLIVTFLYETGARAGELCRLGRRALDEATAAPGPVYRVVSRGKTGEAVLWFTRATAELWPLWRSVRPAGGDAYAVVAWRVDGQPGPMSTAGISKMLARHCERAGVTPFRAHALRHAKVKRAKAAAGLETASRLIGHGSAMMTAAYGRADDEELQAAALATGLRERLL